MEASDRLFRAVDRADTAAVLKIDNEETEPSIGAMETAVLAAAEAKHQESLGQLGSLQALEGSMQQCPLIVSYPDGNVLAVEKQSNFETSLPCISLDEHSTSARFSLPS